MTYEHAWYLHCQGSAELLSVTPDAIHVRFPNGVNLWAWRNGAPPPW